MENRSEGYEKNILIGIIVFLVICSLALFLLSYLFNPSFVIKYSPDSSLKDETLHKISLMKNILLIGGIIPLLIIALMFYRDKATIRFVSRRKNLIINIGMLIITLVLFFLITETVLWLMLKDETSFSSTGPASLKFNEQYVKLNSQGFRDYEFSTNKESDVTRIAIVGDSLSFGSGIRNVNDTYPKLLEKHLNEKYGKYEVYNFGIPGYDANQELATIRDKVVNYHPDIIIIEYYENDLENVDPALKNAENIENYEIPFVGFWLRETSYTYYFFESRFNRAAENFGFKKKWLDTLNVTYNSEYNRNYNLDVYKQIEDIAKNNNAEVIMVAFPVISDFKDYKFNIVRDFAKEIANKNGFKFIDLLPAFSNYTSEQVSVNKYDYHPNELGHKIAAEEILKSFIN